MAKIRRGGYVFLSWKGDHGNHVHVYRDGKSIVKWDIDNWRPMAGQAPSRVRNLLRELKEEGRL